MAMSSGAVCPACGVAVMPGYVRCPKCRKPLPRRAATSQVQGGTAVESRSRGSLYAIIGAAVLAIGLLMFLGLRGKSDKAAPPAAAPVQTATTPEAPRGPETTVAVQAPSPTATTPAAPDPTVAAGELERALKRQRLWATVSVTGTRVDVRSGSCSDPAMGPALDGAVAAFKAAGLTKLRCLEQSGAVVTDRDL